MATTEISLSLGFSFAKNGASIQRSLSGTVAVAGTKAIQNVQNIGTGDETLALGDVATPGILILHNLGAYVEVTTPSAPVITNAGIGATTWSYKIVARQSAGAYSAASSAGSTTTGNPTLSSLSGGNYNNVAWAAVDGADSYDIYRTSAGGTPSSTGKIGNTVSLTFDDIGYAGDASTAPATGVDNVILLGADGSSYPNKLKGEEFSVVRHNGAAIHAKANTIATDLEYILISD